MKTLQLSLIAFLSLASSHVLGADLMIFDAEEKNSQPQVITNLGVPRSVSKAPLVISSKKDAAAKPPSKVEEDEPKNLPKNEKVDNSEAADADVYGDDDE